MDKIKVGDFVDVYDERLVDNLSGMVTGEIGRNKCEVYIQGEPFIIKRKNLKKTNEIVRTIKKITHKISS